MKYTLSFFTALMAASSLLAQEEAMMNTTEESSKSSTASYPVIQKHRDPYEQIVPSENHPPEMSVTLSISPQIKNGSAVTASTSFIWWKAYLNGLEYATSGYTDTGNTYVPFGSSVGEGRISTPGYSFEPGFKLGLGGPCHHDGWEVWGEYTWLGGSELTTSATASARSGLTSLIHIRLPNGSSSLFSAYSANSQLSQQFNLLDVELARSFFVSSNLIVRPHLGMKTAWIQENVRFNYVMSPSAGVTVGTQTVLSASAVRNQNMWGLGIRTGLNTDWKLTRNFAFFGKFAASALWTDFHSHARDLTLTSGIGHTTNLNTKQAAVQVTPVLETAFGLSYVNWLPDETYRFMGRIGWEFQEWFDMNHLLLGNTSGNLTLQGLTVDFNVTF